MCVSTKQSTHGSEIWYISNIYGSIIYLPEDMNLNVNIKYIVFKGGITQGSVDS